MPADDVLAGGGVESLRRLLRAMPGSFDLADLRLVVYIADTSSLTRAAGLAHVSVPAASVRVRNLEEKVGVRLFYRARGGVTLTPPGEAFVHHARLVLQQLDRLEGDIHEYKLGTKGHLRIVATTTATTEFLPAVLGRFLADRPDISVDVRERVSYNSVRAVRDGGADLGIVPDDVPTEGLATVPYRKHRLVLAAAASHPLARRRTIAFQETLAFDFIGMPETSSMQLFLVAAAARSDQRLRMRAHVGNFEAICRMIEAGIGVGVLPESAARRYAKSMSVRVIDLTDKWAQRQLLVCVRSLRAIPGYARELIAELAADAR